jgi:hypothetical protein
MEALENWGLVYFENQSVRQLADNCFQNELNTVIGVFLHLLHTSAMSK